MSATFRLFRVLFFLIGVAALPAFAAPKITVAGATPGGPRPAFSVLISDDFADAAEGWKPLFEAQCGCVATFRGVGDALALLPALRSGGADAVVGLPLSALEEARASERFAAHGQPAPLSLPASWSNTTFMPVDYGWIGFAYDTTRLTAAPASFPELAKAGPNALRVAVDDPRASAAGLDAVAWMRVAHKDAAGAMWAGTAPKLVIAKSRAAALAMLEKGEVDLALAATTWPTLRAKDGKLKYRIAPFREGQLLQIESAAMLKDAAQPRIAAQFLAFLVTPEAQALIASTRGLYPVHPAAALPETFGKVTLPSWSLAATAPEFAAHRANWLAEWDAALAK